MKLHAKMMVFFLLLAFVSGSLIIGLTWRSVQGIVATNLVNVALHAVTQLADEAAPGLQARSESLLLPVLQEIQHSSGAGYAEALDLDGNVLAHTNVSEKGKKYSDLLTRIILHETRTGTAVVRKDKNKILEAWAPVWSMAANDAEAPFLFGVEPTGQHRQRLGTVRLSLPLQEAENTERQIIRQMSAIVVSIVSVGFLAGLFLLRHFLYRIKLLTQGTARIAQGIYGTEVPVIAHDELADLAISFNHMSRVLSETTVSKNYMADILSHMVDPLVVMDMNGRIRMVNQAVLDLLGYERRHLEGQHLHFLFVDKDHPEQEVAEERLIIGGSVRNVELEFCTKSSARIPVLFSSSLLKDETGASTGIIAVAKDMTERKRLESIIRQSDKMSAVGQLAAGVAHEINNPLGVILGFAQAVVRRLVPNDPLEMPLKSIEKEAVRCRNLVQDLLTFSRSSKVDREPVDLNRAVEGAFSLVIAQARMTRIEVTKNLTPDMPPIAGNLNQIQQIIINLANNALDAIGDAAGEVAIKTKIVKEGPLAWVCLQVVDTGPGIPPDILPRIFEPFFTTKPVGKGTGLGLSLVHEIIKKHSGTTDVESRRGYTAFTIRFPVPQILESELGVYEKIRHA